MAGIRKKGNAYYCTFRFQGRRYYFTVGDMSEAQAKAKGADELDTAVWEHVKGLLNDPATLLEQFEACAQQADNQQTNERAEQKKWEGQLRRLDREEQRLLDAYQAEIIELEQLKERRQEIALRRQALSAQREQQTRLWTERQVAREVWADLKAFCEQIRGRLEDATLAEKQQLLQLLIERVIVGEDTLEIRHVIPLRRQKLEAIAPASPDDPSGGSVPTGSRPEAGDERLRSAGVRPTLLVPPLGQVAVYAVPVAGQHPPVIRAHQCSQGSAVAAAGDLVRCSYRCHHYPQPAASAHRCLIDVGWLLSGRRQQFVHDRLQLSASLRLGGADRRGKIHPRCPPASPHGRAGSMKNWRYPNAAPGSAARFQLPGLSFSRSTSTNLSSHSSLSSPPLLGRSHRAAAAGATVTSR